MSDNKYQVIKLPAGIDASVFDEMYLGKSEKGVYCAVVENEDYRLQVLFLDESGGRMEWVFKYDINLAPLVVHLALATTTEESTDLGLYRMVTATSIMAKG